MTKFCDLQQGNGNGIFLLHLIAHLFQGRTVRSTVSTLPQSGRSGIERQASIRFVGGGNGASQSFSGSERAGVGSAQTAASIAEILIQTVSPHRFAECVHELCRPAAFRLQKRFHVLRLLTRDLHGVCEMRAADT